MGRPKRARLPPPNLQASKGGRLKIQLPTAHGTLGGLQLGPSVRVRGGAWGRVGRRSALQAPRSQRRVRGSCTKRAGRGSWVEGTAWAEALGGHSPRMDRRPVWLNGWGALSSGRRHPAGKPRGGGGSARVSPCPSQSAHTADTDGCGSPRQAVLCATHGWPTAYLSPTRLHPP